MANYRDQGATSWLEARRKNRTTQHKGNKTEEEEDEENAQGGTTTNWKKFIDTSSGKCLLLPRCCGIIDRMADDRSTKTTAIAMHVIM